MTFHDVLSSPGIFDPQSREASAREVGKFGLWHASSAKLGNGVALLRDGSSATYWQSDGLQPHVVDVTFPFVLPLSHVALYLDYNQDESYTPRRVSVAVGYDPADTETVADVDIPEPHGWVIIPIAVNTRGRGVSAMYLKLEVKENQQNGRDSHIRQFLVFSATPAARTCGVSAIR
eukprot:TRINITY_DN60060_c0_g1_i1.p1 TRINITY_DN60060_c0_g1~~TRINITY_DN60060_c0_g1_i1.p1  ORF type:complete len:176 (+),score=9.37 TRINITY_DN60060_c0_g1_i1:244-771(+)